MFKTMISNITMLVHNFLANKSSPFIIEVSRSTHRTSSDAFLIGIDSKLVLGGGNGPMPTKDIELGEGEEFPTKSR